MSAILEGKYLKILPIKDITVCQRKGLGFAIQSKYLLEYYKDTSQLTPWGKEYYACVCFIYPDKNDIEVELHDNHFNTVFMYNGIKDPIDTYELTMEYANCVDFARQACLDALNSKIDKMMEGCKK